MFPIQQTNDQAQNSSHQCYYQMEHKNWQGAMGTGRDGNGVSTFWMTGTAPDGRAFATNEVSKGDQR